MHETDRIHSRFRRRKIVINIVTLVLVALLAIPCYCLRQRYMDAYDRWRDCVMQLRSDALDLQELKQTPYQYLSSEQKQKLNDLTAEQSALGLQRTGLTQQVDLWNSLFTISITALGLIMVAGVIAQFFSARQHQVAVARAKFGYCARCGYDLRGSAERCPECGTAHDFDRDRAMLL